MTGSSAGKGVGLQAPFPFFGGKSRAAPLIWERFGPAPNYIEPFAGSLAVLLARPHPPKTETVNDADGLLVNVWRSIKADPDAVAYYADNPVHELDLTARHLWLVERRETLTKRLEADPDFHDPKAAGWWVWGACCWLGSGWCTGDGPWQRVGDEVVKVGGTGVNRQLPHLGNAGRGVNRQLPKISRASGGILDFSYGAVMPKEALYEWMRRLAERLRTVRVTTGDFERVLSESVTVKHGVTAVLLDPPYDHDGDRSMYPDYDHSAAERARAWAVANADNPLLRIALCGYGEHAELAEHGFTAVPWRARKGYQKVEDGHHSGHDEVIWFSPHCLAPEAAPLFAEF